jgi:putative phage-type endonuclease
VNTRAEWLAKRTLGIGGSDAAAILGLSPWRTPMDVWLEKTGRVEPDNEINEDREFLLALGTEMEAGIARLYTRKTGRELEIIPPGAVLIHPKHHVLLGTPDRLVLGESRGVEIKMENSFQHKFGEVGEPGAIPELYEIQCRHYMAITDRDVWDLPVLKGGAKLNIHTLDRDRELEDMLIEQLLDWWNTYVIPDVPPPLDGSDAWTRYLGKQFRSNVLPLKQADESAEFWFRMREDSSEEIARFQSQKAEAENHLREIIGEHEGLQGSFGRFTWKKTKDSKTTDFEKASRVRVKASSRCWIPTTPNFSTSLTWHGKSRAASTRRLERRTSPKPGYRRFHHSPTKPTNDQQLATASKEE